MVKPAWGLKRKCLKCDAFFYDMKKAKFRCPKCGETYTEDSYAEIKNKKLLKMARRGAPKFDDENLDEEALLQMTGDIPLGDDVITGDNLDLLEDSDDMVTDRSEINDIMDGFDEEEKNGQ